MEIKRKKLSTADILEAEKVLTGELAELVASLEGDFHDLGYELVTELQQKENAEFGDYELLTEGEDKTYPVNYLSRALITVRRETKEETAEPEETVEEETAEEETLRNAEEKLERTVAFTELMLVRTYKSFWVEWVSISDSTDVVREDLSEFLTVLREKAAQA